MASPSSLKRQGATLRYDQPPAKRQQSTLDFDTNMRPVRRTVTGVLIPLNQGITLPAEHEEEFVDAPEEQDHLADGGGDVMDVVTDQREDDVDVQHSEGGEDDEEDDDDDLFAKAFGNVDKRPPQEDDSEDENAGNEDDDSDDSRGVATKLSAKAKGKQRATDYDFVKYEHTDDCNGARSASTPPGSPTIKPEISKTPSIPDYGADARRSTSTAPLVAPQQPPQPKEANLERDQSRALKFHRKFHDKAYQLRPRLPLASHRYWIGVLNVDRKPINAKDEKHFTWMKGNRFTTVATVWHTYQTTTMTDGFVLLLGGVENVDFKDRCEELDYFNDKFVLFRAVDAKDPVSKGTELGAGCPPVVIQIDD